ncbi:MAG: hypothetical protein KDD94_04420, partial [Calditrichaeota bacterium]|nr:hypothetical protein [Calditrichota bacterium]
MNGISFTNYNALALPAKNKTAGRFSNFKNLFKSIAAKYRNQRSNELNAILNSSFSGKRNFDEQFSIVKLLETDWIVLVFNHADLSLNLLGLSSAEEL